MQTKQVFLVFDFTHTHESKPQIFGVFDNPQSAIHYAKKLENENADSHPEVMPIFIKIGKEETECQSFDFRKHIAFDITKMEMPAKCDSCMQHATHFCLTHRGIYCTTHITNHEDGILEFYKKESFKIRIRDSKGNKIDGVGFSEEDIELIVQQTGVEKEIARKALVEAKGDLAKAILLLNTE